jgi:hypothetical protein
MARYSVAAGGSRHSSCWHSPSRWGPRRPRRRSRGDERRRGDPPGESAGGPDRKPAWKVDAAESLARSLEAGERPGGKLVYVDEHGRRRGLPAERGTLAPEELRAAADALSSALGAPDPDYARLAAVERLTEMRAAGALSEEDFERERRRLMGGG